MSDVSICICTFRRPAGLRRLLASLARLDAATPPREIIVVDNDAAASGEPSVRAARAEGLEVHYVVEPQRGIARARNRSVAPARGEFVAFIDDDEEADPLWLARLYDGVTGRGADGGIGPVLPVFPPCTPAWLIDGGFFDRPRPPTGTVLMNRQCRTGNALVRRNLLAALPGPFEERLALTGGEDTFLFHRLVAVDGRRIVAVDDAIVREHLSPARVRVRWLLWRRFVVGVSGARLYTSTVPIDQREPWQRVRALRGAIRLGVEGMVLLPASRTDAVHRLMLAASQVGRFAFYSGLSVQPYGHDSWR